MKQTNLSNISYDDIKLELQEYVKNNSNFTDWDFEGSNISFLISMLAYTAYYANVYNSFSLNESFLDTATLRKSVVSHAKQQGYIPYSANSAYMFIDISLDTNEIVDNGLPIPETVIIPQYTQFIVKHSDKTFNFYTDKTYVLYKNGDELLSHSVKLLEGNLITIQTTYNLTNEIVLPKNVDTKTIKLEINGKKWEYSKNQLNGGNVYYIKENMDGVFVIYFGDGIVSNKPNEFDVIRVDCLQCSEDIPNANNNTQVTIEYPDKKIINNLDYAPFIKLTINEKPKNGAKLEQTESVRKHAFERVTTQDRAITLLDYKYIITSIFHDIVDDCSVWDYYDLKKTNEESLDQLGNVYVSVKPKYNKFLTPFEMDKIANTMHSKYIIPGISINFIEPLYIYVKHDIKVFYDEIKTDINMFELKKRIIDSLKDAYTKISKFETYLPLSFLQSVVDKSYISIVSNMIEPSFYIKLNIDENYDYNLNIKLKNEIIQNSISLDYYNIHDDNGNIVAEFTEGVFTNIGTVDYQTGEISFTIDATYNTSDITKKLNFDTVDKYFKTYRNLVFAIDDNDVTFNMVIVK